MSRACVFALALLLLATIGGSIAYRDDDFEEFDDEEVEFDFDVDDSEDQGDNSEDLDYGEEDPVSVTITSHEWPAEADKDAEVEADKEDDMFDGEEFEDITTAQRQTPDEIKISESTVQRKPFWQAYMVELVIVAGMCLYLLNYFIGRTRNTSLAYSWFEAHRDLLEANFALVGDTGEGDDPTEGELVRLADDEFTLWSSGRLSCIGMLTHIKLSPRHDLFSMFTGLFQSAGDSVTVIFQLGDEDMDSLVFAVGQKKALQKMVKDFQDLHNFTPNLKPLSRASSSDLFQLSESAEIAGSVLNEKMMAFVAKHSKQIQSIHVTDQYTGMVQDTDDSDVVVVKKPEKRIQITFTGCSVDEECLLMRFAFQLLDHVKTIRLTKEVESEQGRAKAVRNRTKVNQSLEKLQHVQRQEAAQQRREDKVKAAKERMLTETDPEKQRKLEEKENKKARKRNQPKMKSMRVATK